MPVLTRAGLVWATVASQVEGIIEHRAGRLMLVNFFGPYQDAFCAPGWHYRDTQGIASCLNGVELRPEHVTLRCPAGKPRPAP